MFIISKAYIIKGGFMPPLYLITHQRVFSCGLMIYNSFGIGDIQGFALIYLCIWYYFVLLFNTSYLKIMYLYLLNVKSRILFYPSRRLGISSRYKVRRISSRAALCRPCISSRISVYLPAA